MFHKEILCEWRSPHALLTGGLYGLIAVVGVSIAAYNFELEATLAAGLLWIIIAFIVVGTLPRMLLVEEETGTADFLRLTADPHAVYWGKWAFSFIQGLIQSALTTVLFLIFNSIHVQSPALLVLSIIGGTTALTGVSTICGAIAARATNRQSLATTLALPLILPIISWAVTSMRASFGDGFVAAGWLGAYGLLAYGILTVVIGPYIYAALWRK